LLPIWGAGLARWIGYYNTDRPHSALAGATPDEVYGQVDTITGDRLAA
jgi:putative transposase